MSAPRVTVLLATFQGARHLPEQLASLRAQEGVTLRLAASDDGSTDGTQGLLEVFAAQHGGFAAQHGRLLEGPRQGSAANFLHLLTHVEPDGSLLAFCDQDDVWLPSKLARAASALEDHAGPAVWIGGVSLCDEALATCRPIPLPTFPPTFGHLLVEAIGSGNATVLNAAAWALLHDAARAGEAAGVPHHDWWACQMVLGAGGAAILDAEPTTLYRQHGANALGSGHGRPLRALGRLLGGGFARDARAQRRALARSVQRLAPAAREALAALDGLALLSPRARLAVLRRHGVRRARPLAQAGLLALAAMGRL